MRSAGNGSGQLADCRERRIDPPRRSGEAEHVVIERDRFFVIGDREFGIHPADHNAPRVGLGYHQAGGAS